MKLRFPNLAIVLFAAFALLLIQSCKEHTLIDAKVTPYIDNVNTFDTTLPITTKTYFDDALATSSVYGVVFQGVGVIDYDPVFGKTLASTFFQIEPLTFGLDLSGATIDSTVFIMPYSGFTWGDTTNDYNYFFTVKRVTDSLLGEHNYFGSSNAATGEVLGSAAVNIRKLQDSVMVNGVNYAPHLRIKLNDVFKNTILSQYKLISTSPATFFSAFQGLCVTVSDAPSRVLPYFALSNGLSDPYSHANILIYYRDANNVPQQEQVYADGSLAHFNRIQRVYGGFPAGMDTLSTTTSDSILLLQNQPGLGIDLVINNINKMPAGVINKAEIDLPILPFDASLKDNAFSVPDLMTPLRIDNITGLTNTPVDGFPVGNNGLDGLAHLFTYGTTVVNTYTINIPRELQASILRGDSTLHLHINGSTTFYGAYRVRLGGSTNSDTLYRAKLKIVYSKLK